MKPAAAQRGLKGRDERTSTTLLPVENYELSATLNSGQVFRWTARGAGWEGIVHGRWVRLSQTGAGIEAVTAAPCADWRWLENYLQTRVELGPVLGAFPADEAFRRAVPACAGLRLLRQDPWECLASFILSSTKQIVQIQQIVAALCQRFGDPVVTPAGSEPAWSFPRAERIAAAPEAELRACKAGFRAPYLRATAQRVAGGDPALASLAEMRVSQARERLLGLPGVGGKIADCVLLFAYGFQQAFPLDVWVMKALRQLYFNGRDIPVRRLKEFSAGYFGPYAGYAQQYLFHYMRTHRSSRRRTGPSASAVS